MKKLLHIDSAITGANSVSRQLTASVVARLRQQIPDLNVTYLDLAAKPLGHLSSEHLAAWQGSAPEAPDAVADIAAGQAALEDFLAADIVVLGAPMYNFTIPSQLKTWIDRILIAGRTFRYTANGAEGLAGGKRVILALARGGLYGAGTPFAAAEHAETYLRAVFGFIGIQNVEVIVAEGLALGAESKDKAVQGAKQTADTLTA